MGSSRVQEHDAKAPGVSVSSPAVVVGMGTVDDVTSGIPESQNADVLLVRRWGIRAVGIYLAVKSAQGTSDSKPTS